MPTLDLQPTHRRLLLDLLARHAPDAEVWVYGSRVNGLSHEGSDLDLVVRYSTESMRERLRSRALLSEALDESNLPILVEVQDWAQMTEDMRREAERCHVVLRTPAAVSSHAK